MNNGLAPVKALVWDTFGTVVDWRRPIMKQAEAVGRRLGVEGEWGEFANQWRRHYLEATVAVGKGEHEYTTCAEIHRERLDQLIVEYGLTALSETERAEFNKAWHRLDPWPDAVEGLTRLKRKYVIGPLSNGDFGMLVEMGKFGGLPWDCVLSGSLVRTYKTDPRMYRFASAQLGYASDEVMMCAAHVLDLRAAKAAGLRTAFIRRPDEFGPAGHRLLEPDMEADPDFDVAADSIIDLANKLDA